MIYTHTLLGASATYILIKNHKFSKIQKNILYFLGIVGSTFPDFDLILMFFKPAIQHRDLLSHSLIPYSILFLVVMLILRKSSDFAKMANTSFFLGVLTHLFSDLLFGGLVLFAPFTGIRFGFPIAPFENRFNWAVSYFHTRYMLIEVLIAGIYAYLWRKEKNSIFRGFPIFWVVVAAFILGLLVFFE